MARKQLIESIEKLVAEGVRWQILRYSKTSMKNFK